jgi:hypothetical protein
MKLKLPLAVCAPVRRCARRPAGVRRRLGPSERGAGRVTPRSHDQDTRHPHDAESRPCRVPTRPRATADNAGALHHLALPWSKTPPRRPLPAPLPRPHRFAGAVPKTASPQAAASCLVNAGAVQSRTAAPFSSLAGFAVPLFFP